MRRTEHKEANETLKAIRNQPQSYLIIHYSCESFDNLGAVSPRITSIAVKSLASGQTQSFSIHKEAETSKEDIKEIDSKYDKLEKNMLDSFFNHVKKQEERKWLHWNMNAMKYGFQAIDHRYEVLGGKPEHINDSCKIDIAHVLIKKYGSNYIEHPRLENLIKLNGLSDKDFLPGKEEAQAFAKGEYIKMHDSTLRKIEILNQIINYAADNRLKTKANLKEKYGSYLQGLFELTQTHWLPGVLWPISLVVIGAILGCIFSWVRCP